MTIFVRAATQQDRDVLAGLHFRAYYNRFFDEAAQDRQGRLYGAPLRREFPALAAGQNAEYFRGYWKKFSAGLAEPDPRRRNYCLVAEEGGVPLAFLKGNAMVEGQMRDLFNRAARGDADKCCELGSIYCDPASKYQGVGRLLVAAFARTMRDAGCETMLTCAYDKNDSPAFFEKLGGSFMGACRIPNDYLTPEGVAATVDIPGVWLYWDAKGMAAAAGPR